MNASKTVRVSSKGGLSRIHSCAWSVANHTSYLTAVNEREAAVLRLLAEAAQLLQQAEELARAETPGAVIEANLRAARAARGEPV